MDNLEKWYQSVTTGNIVRTRREVLHQMWESFVKLRTMDFQWRVLWLAPSVEVP